MHFSYTLDGNEIVKAFETQKPIGDTYKLVTTYVRKESPFYTD